MKLNNKEYFYALVLDENAGRYYGTKIKDIIIIDDYDYCMIITDDDERVGVPLRNMFSTCDEMLDKLMKINMD